MGEDVQMSEEVEISGEHERVGGSQVHLSLKALSQKPGLIPQECLGIDLLPCSSLSLLVRNAYTEMDNILELMNEEYQKRLPPLEDLNFIPGVLITGSPGIGKILQNECHLQTCWLIRSFREILLSVIPVGQMPSRWASSDFSRPPDTFLLF